MDAPERRRRGPDSKPRKRRPRAGPKRGRRARKALQRAAVVQQRVELTLADELQALRNNRTKSREQAAKHLRSYIRTLDDLRKNTPETPEGLRALRHAPVRVQIIEILLREARGTVPEDRDVRPGPEGAVNVGRLIGDVQILNILNLPLAAREEYGRTGKLPPAAWSDAAAAAERAVRKPSS